MRAEQLEALRRALVEGPVTAEAAQVYADALEEAGHPFAPFARGRHECTEAELPEEIAGWLLAGRRGLTERLVLEHGLLREVRFAATPTLGPVPDGWRFRQEAMGYEVDDEEVDGLEQRSASVVQLLTHEVCGSVTHVSGLLFETFRRLCEEDVRLTEVSVIEDAPTVMDEQFWWCGTEAESGSVGLLRVRELVMEWGHGSPGHTLRWLSSSCRPVFEGLERVRAPDADVCVALLTEGTPGALRVIEARDWRATRDGGGWHLVVGAPADGERLDEDLASNAALDERARLIARLAGFVTDVREQGPQLPEGELRRLEAAASGKPDSVRARLPRGGDDDAHFE